MKMRRGPSPPRCSPGGRRSRPPARRPRGAARPTMLPLRVEAGLEPLRRSSDGRCPPARSSSRLRISFTGRFTAFDDQRGVDRRFDRRAPAEAAAEELLVDASPCRAWCRAPCATSSCVRVGACVPTQMSTPSRAHVRGGVHRLHLRVVDVVAEVLAAHAARRAGHAPSRVALRLPLDADALRIAAVAEIGLEVLVGVDARRRAGRRATSP